MGALEFLTVIQQHNFPKIQTILNQFKDTSGISVQGMFVGWDTLWHELVNTGIYKKGADISEVGTSWLDSLVAMNALRPFTPYEVQLIGGEKAFLPAAWSTVHIGKRDEVWGIPVRSDPRMIWYWKDMVEDAGLDPQRAFSSLEGLPDTLTMLKKVINVPMGIGTSGNDLLTVQTLASWLWQAGGEFASPDGKEILFTDADALAGIKRYFNLLPYIVHQANLAGGNLAVLFTERKVAALVAGPWIFERMHEINTPPEMIAKVGVTNIPAPAFVGGTVLTLWQHCREPERAFKFIQYLTSPQVQLEYAQLIGLLPSRQEPWKNPPLSTDPFYQTIYRALTQGRSLPSIPLWGMIEDRLAKIVSGTWYELFNQPNPNIDQVVTKNITALARRLSLSV